MVSFPGDFFDSLLNNSCWILAKGAGSKDAYGQESQDFTAVATNVPCAIAGDSPGRPKEFKSEKEASLNYRRVFMRVPTLSPPGKVTPHHWLAFNVTANPSGNVKIGGTQYSADLYNIFEQINPFGAGHHLELIVEQVIG